MAGIAERGGPLTERPETRLARLRMRSWRRGTREMDLILGPFADTAMARLEPAEVDAYEALVAENDQDLYLWISGRGEAPEAHRAIVDRIRAERGFA